MKRKTQKSSFAEYKMTLILFSILLAIMSLVIFMPQKRQKLADPHTANFSK